MKKFEKILAGIVAGCIMPMYAATDKSEDDFVAFDGPEYTIQLFEENPIIEFLLVSPIEPISVDPIEYKTEKLQKIDIRNICDKIEPLSYNADIPTYIVDIDGHNILYGDISKFSAREIYSLFCSENGKPVQIILDNKDINDNVATLTKICGMTFTIGSQYIVVNSYVDKKFETVIWYNHSY